MAFVSEEAPGQVQHEQAGSGLLFRVAPSAALRCVVCAGLFVDPVISIMCGHTFCRQCILPNSGTEGQCPVDDKSVNPDKLVPNLAVSGQILDLPVYCRHAVCRPQEADDSVSSMSALAWNLAGEEVGCLDAANGCTATLTLGTLDEHDAQCEFAPVPCPNGSDECGLVRRMDLDNHNDVCHFNPCCNVATGCDFAGTLSQVADHEKSCTQNDPVAHHTQVLRQLRGMCESLAALGENLGLRMSELESRQAHLELTAQQCWAHLHQKKQQKSPALSRWSSRSAPAAAQANRVSPFVQRSEAMDVSGELVMPFNLQCIGTFAAHTGTVWVVAAHEDLLFTTGSDDSINIWDLGLSNPAKIGTLSKRAGVVHSLVISNGYLYSGDSEKTVRVWDLADFQEIGSWQASDDIVCALAVAKGLLFTASFATIKVWSISPPHRCVKTITEGLNHWVRALQVDSEQRYIYSVCHNVIHRWDVATATCTKTLTTQFGSVHSIVVTNDLLVIGTYNQNIHLYDIRSFEHVGVLGGHLGTVHALAVSVSGRYLFSASLDTTVKVWNLENRLLWQTLTRHDGSVNAVHWHDGLLFTGSADKTVKVFKAFKGQVQQKPEATPTKAQQTNLQACWGGAQLPPRLVTKQKPKSSTGSVSLADKSLSNNSPLSSSPHVVRVLEAGFASDV